MITVRTMEPGDVPACVTILNHIIAVGGTTAYETPYTHDHFAERYLEISPVTNTALFDGRIVGFQAVFSDGPDFYSVGTFADRKNPVKGTGKALFAKTLADCQARGGEAILAKITSDNTGALVFYGKMGFVDWKILPNDLTRKDGTVVDRVIKRFDLQENSTAV